MKWSIPEKVIDRARIYVAEKRVLVITPFLEKKIWTAEVMGSEIYHVELDGTTRESDFCECPYWKDHGYCKHTVAVELALKEQGVSRVMTAENAEKMTAVLPDPGQELTESFTRVFLKENREIFLEVEDKLELMMEYKVEIKSTSNSLIRNNDEVLALSLRAGLDKLYIVKDVASFFESYHNQGTFDLNTNQTLDFKQIKISAEDSLILDFLGQQAASNEMMGVGSKEPKSIYSNKRYLVISPILAEETIQLIQENGKLQFFVGENKHKRMIFVPNQLPISFELFQQNQKISLYINNQTDARLKAYHWFIAKHAIFQPSKEQLRA